jgi:type IV pilus assembly protein PilB
MRAKPRLGELLVESGVIDAAQLQSALGEQRQWGRPLGMTLVRMGFIDEDTLIHTLAAQLKLPVVKLSGKRVAGEVLERVPYDLAEKHRCIPLLVNDEGGQQVLYLGMEDPANLEAIDEIRFRVASKVKPVLVAPSELAEALKTHYQWAAEAAERYPEATSASDEKEARVESEPEFIVRHSESEAFAAEPASAPPTRSAPQRKAGVPPAAILRALSQLLVEKGVITRHELVERVSAVVREDDADL